jgi:hypothetical protein
MAARGGPDVASTAGIVPTNSPPLGLPLGYFVAGLAAFVTVNLVLVLDGSHLLAYELLPDDLALTHLATLGWVTMVMMGALCQLTPVILQTRLAHPRLLRWQFWLYIIGVAGLVLSFRSLWTLGLAVFGSMVLLGVLVFLWAMARTLWRPPAWPLTGHYLAHSLGYLGMTVLAGITFALDLHFHWFPIPRRVLAAHVDLGLAGWFTLTLIGVNYQLLPMFALVHGHDLRLGRWILRVVNLGVSLLFVSLLFDLPRAVFLVAALSMAAGILAYVVDVYRMFRLRRRRIMDLTQQHTVASTLSLLAAVAVGLRIALVGPASLAAQTHWDVGLVYIVIGGWLSLSIMGQSYKILPFLVWQHRYSERVGHEPVPLLRDLYSDRRASLAFWCYLAGFVIVALSLLAGNDAGLRLGALLTLAGSLGFAWTFVEVLSPHRMPAVPVVSVSSQGR